MDHNLAGRTTGLATRLAMELSAQGMEETEGSRSLPTDLFTFWSTAQFPTTTHSSFILATTPRAVTQYIFEQVLRRTTLPTGHTVVELETIGER
jgi:hypothetical protein